VRLVLLLPHLRQMDKQTEALHDSHQHEDTSRDTNGVLATRG
jgi:hypothetical protein